MRKLKQSAEPGTTRGHHALGAAAEGERRLFVGCDARPVQSRVKNPIQNIMAQHGVVSVCRVQGGSTTILHGRGVEGAAQQGRGGVRQ
jgi:hypothetical protein